MVTTFTASLFGIYSDAEKRMLIQEKLTFIDSQKRAFNSINYKNRCIYKQAQEVVRYMLPDNYLTLKQQIKSAVEQIIATQEFAYYYQYCVMLKAPLIGRDHIKAKEMPIVRPDHTFSQKISEILVATIPVALMQRVEVISYFEACLNYKMDLIDAQFVVAKLSMLEKEIYAYLDALND